MLLRLHRDDDLPTLTALLHRAYQQHADRGIHFMAADQDEKTTRQRAAAGRCYVLEHGDGTIVGTIAVRAGGGWRDVPAVYLDPLTSIFHQYAVDPCHRGVGYGKLLLAAAEADARAHGSACLACDTPAQLPELIHLYESWGMRLVSTVRWPHTNYESAILVKDLQRETRGRTAAHIPAVRE